MILGNLSSSRRLRAFNKQWRRKIPRRLNTAVLEFDPVETRYMRNDQHTVNGLTAYKLGLTQTTISGYALLMVSGDKRIDWGIRVWKRTSLGAVTELTPSVPVAQVYRDSDGSGLQSATWGPSAVALEDTDAIVVKVYMRDHVSTWQLKTTFITEQLGAKNLVGTTWTVYYYTTRSYLVKTDTTSGGFYWGTSTYNSRIENFAWSPAPPPGYILLDSYSESYQYAGLMLADVHPSDHAVFSSSAGQSSQFTAGDPKYKLYQARFFLRRHGSPTGNLVAVLYASTGTHGTDAKPTGSALATSGTVDITTLPTLVYMLVEFNFPAPLYEVVKNTVYIIQCQVQSGVLDGSNYAVIGYDDLTKAHAGNMSHYKNGSWLVMDDDCCFYIYGEAIPPAPVKPLISKPLVNPVLVNAPCVR